MAHATQRHKFITKFDDDKIPAWTYKGSEPNLYTFVTAISLAQLEGQNIRLSAGLQRKLLGFPVFGKLQFRIEKDGTFSTTRKVCFGTDWENFRGLQIEIAEAARQGLRFYPGACGRKIYNGTPEARAEVHAVLRKIDQDKADKLKAESQPK